MPRKRVHKSPRFSTPDYRINVTETSGVFEASMQRIVDMVEACLFKGRWSVIHLRYVLGDGATNQLFLNEVRQWFGGDNVRYVWALEQSKQDEGLPHYHLALFLKSRDVSMVHVQTLMHGLVREKALIKSYRRMPPAMSKVPADVLLELDGEDLIGSMSRYGLTLTNVSAARFAVYWLSYLAKVKTKPERGRTFGSSLLPQGWKETATRQDMVQKLYLVD